MSFDQNVGSLGAPTIVAKGDLGIKAIMGKSKSFKIVGDQGFQVSIYSGFDRTLFHVMNLIMVKYSNSRLVQLTLDQDLRL